MKEAPVPSTFAERAEKIIDEQVVGPETAMAVFEKFVGTTIGGVGVIPAHQDHSFGFAPSSVGLNVCSQLRERFSELGDQFRRITQEEREKKGY